MYFDTLNAVAGRHARMANTNGWLSRHNAAFTNPRGFEVLFVNTIHALGRYADEHSKRYESPIGEDGVLGEAWLNTLKGLRATLNGELGRLDGGYCDALICQLALDNGFAEDEL